MRPLYLLTFLTSVALATGCGKVNNFPDASGSGDDTIDGSTLDGAERGEVKVTVLSGNNDSVGVEGAPVVFLDPDGTLVKLINTTADGKAAADVLPGGSVTVVSLNPDGANLSTVLAVKPGDDLLFGARATPPSLPFANQTMTVSYTPYNGATGYQLIARCAYAPLVAGDITSLTATLVDCPGEQHEFMIQALGFQNAVIAYAHADAQTLTNGGTVTVPNNWGTTRPMTVNFTNVPNTIGGINLRYVQPSPDGYQMSYAYGNAAINGATASSSFEIGPNFWPPSLTTSIYRSQGTFRDQYQLAHPTGTTFGVDLGEALLPWVTSVGFDAATATMAWATDGPGSYDGLYAEAYWQHQIDPNTTHYFRWVIVSPGDGTSLTLPTLPPEIGALRPVAGDYAQGDVGLVDLDAANYDEFRQTAQVEYNTVIYARYSETPYNVLRVSGLPNRD